MFPSTERASVSVCLPALDEAATIGSICTLIRERLLEPGIIDQLLVIDSDSSDDTAEIARTAGAEVFEVRSILPHVPAAPGGGKGEAMWRSLAVATGDIVVWLDADVENLEEHFVTSLVSGLEDPRTVMVKGYYRRPTSQGRHAGGRVTELVARPLLNLFAPELSRLIQPLSGECAARRQAMLDIPFFTGYAVEIGMLLGVADRFGADTIQQVDLGSRVHRERDQLALGRTAFEITSAFMRLLDDQGRVKLLDELPEGLIQFDEEHEAHHLRLAVQLLPPMAEVLGPRGQPGAGSPRTGA